MSEEEAKVEAAAETSETESSTTNEPAPKKKGKKWPIVVGVVVVVLIAAGAGFWVWHEQPSFCNAICHTPMDPYLPTYEAEPGQPAVDKWGNDVADASGMMAAVHRVSKDQGGAEATCMSCHVPTIGEQVSEGMSWISGNYYYPLEERDLEELVAARGLEEDQFCLNEACHTQTRDDLIAATSELGKYNPHTPQHNEQACSNCHKAHRASVNACTQCHTDAYVPEGWLTYSQANSLNS
ncbi:MULTISPECIES: cytochrome c3 family protein [Gordonibacter]|uniref:Cytochrome c3 family protein n=1 Tax=Gordonibacter faecis TaxID=3047475 RepID=A0ABT7DLE8_9ACTN|nr:MULTISPECIES: cytochrome c3 family protein [unclassified Gordonibacter]MDJ1650348.1 cytochrome c3 family protein [Gordonibacter sp. KGMB12511]HIW76805.1 cytochrome c3 family protein [Candidatus Gordonibacter avicola]